MSKYLITLIIIVLLGGVGYYFIASRGTSTVSHRSYQIEVTSGAANVKPNEPITFAYKIKNDKGEILKNYEVAHEKIMHFIVVRKDLQYFQHLHPDFNQTTGAFTVNITFSTDGPYRVFPDFTPTEENPQKLPVTVYHDVDVGDMSKYMAQPVVPDTQLKKTVGEYKITYNFPAEIMMRNEINYSLSIEKNNQPVKDLENYLGALGHSVILKESSLDFIHTHTVESEDESNQKEHGGGHIAAREKAAKQGNKIDFSTTLPESGVYKIFTQFKHQGKAITTDYAIEVNQG